MSLFTDILKGLPENAVLRDKVREAETNQAKLETENAILKDDLREANAEIAKLKKQVEERTHREDLHEIEIQILKHLTEISITNATPKVMHQWANLSETRCEYHVQRLDDAGYAHVVYNDGWGSHYALSQKGRELLVEKDLI